VEKTEKVRAEKVFETFRHGKIRNAVNSWRSKKDPIQRITSFIQYVCDIFTCKGLLCEKNTLC
jgi:hypothetical protein